MNIRLKRVLVSVTISLLLPASMTLPAFAEGGSGSGGDATKIADTTQPTASTSGSTETKVKKTEVEIEHAKELEGIAETENHDHAKKILDDAKKKGKEHTKEERLKNCTDKQQGLVNKLANLQKNSSSHLGKIDAVLVKLTDSQATAKTPVAGYAALLAAATAEQAQAAASVAALGNLSTKIDCTKDTVASEVATFKAAAEQARSDLKAYRDAVKAILKAIETSAGAQ